MVVTSYEIVIADSKLLQRYTWKYIIVDEGHRLKNFNCKLLRELRQIPVDNKLLLTGVDLVDNATLLQLVVLLFDICILRPVAVCGSHISCRYARLLHDMCTCQGVAAGTCASFWSMHVWYVEHDMV